MWVKLADIERKMGGVLRYRLKEDPSPDGPPDGHTIRFRYALQGGRVWKEAWMPDVEAFFQRKGIKAAPPPEGWIPVTELVRQGVDRFFIHNFLNRKASGRIPRWRVSYKRTFLSPEGAAEILAAWKEKVASGERGENAS